MLFSVSNHEIIDLAINEMNQLLSRIEETNQVIAQKRNEGDNYNNQIDRLKSIKDIPSNRKPV